MSCPLFLLQHIPADSSITVEEVLYRVNKNKWFWQQYIMFELLDELDVLALTGLIVCNYRIVSVDGTRDSVISNVRRKP